MMRYKKLLFIVIIIPVFACLLIINCIHKKDDYFSSSIAITCVGQKYEKKSDKSYLTFELSDKKIIKTITIDEKLTDEVSQNNVNDIIGIQVIMNIPQKEIDKRHLNTKDLNLAWVIFEEGMFDDYCEIVDVSFVG